MGVSAAVCADFVDGIDRLLMEVDLCAKSGGKADLLSDHFDGKQSKESVDLPLTCHPSPRLTSFAFRASEVRRLLLDLDPYICSGPLGQRMLWPPRLSVMFRRLARPGSFPACCRQANVTPIPICSPSSSVANHRQISITSVFS